MAPRVASPILTETMLVRFRERAPGYDPMHPHQLCPHARGRRQADARDRPRHAAALALRQC